MVDMQKTRIVSRIRDTWGEAVVFKERSLKSVQQITSEVMPSKEMITEAEEVSSPIEEAAENPPMEDIPITENDCLSYLEASMYASTLEDIITQIRILNTTNNELRIHKTMSDMGLLLALKYQVEQPPVTDELEGIDQNDLGCLKYKLNKLDADRKYFYKVMTDLYCELAIERTFDTLKKNVKAIEDRDENFRFLGIDEAKNKIQRRELNKQLRQQRNHIKSVIYDTDATIEVLSSQVEDAVLNAECRSRYVDNWQIARTEQHRQSIKDWEYLPSTNIEYFKRRFDHEQRVHAEVELLGNIMINETLGKVENWMEKYDKDMEHIDLKIQIKKNEYQNQRDRRIELEETIETHDKLMKDWIHFKEEREKARLYREKMTNAAITVQAWWRGLLVRLQLGPYKVSKKKGAGPPGAKKK